MSLPRSLDELDGRRAAHWGRESTGRQADRFGPEAQREQRDRAIGRYRMVDTGITWQIAHSGRTIGTTHQFGEMLARAGRDYDVLVVGYNSRFARDLRTAVNARHELHCAGAALLFADERVLSSDEDAWEAWAREAVEAEAYSRRLGKRVREGYAAKARTCADQGGGLVPVGFRRVGERKLMEPDPETMPLANRAWELAAQDGTIASATGLSLWRISPFCLLSRLDGHDAVGASLAGALDAKPGEGGDSQFATPSQCSGAAQGQRALSRGPEGGRRGVRSRVCPAHGPGPRVRPGCAQRSPG